MADIRSTVGTLDLNGGVSRFRRLVEGGRGRKILAVEQDVGAFFLGEQPFYLASHGLCLRPDDPMWAGQGIGSGKNQRYQPRIKRGFTTRRSLVNGSLMRGRSVPDTAQVSIIASDVGGALPPPHNVIGRGAKILLASDGWWHEDWKTLFRGICTGFDPSADNRSATLSYENSQRHTQRELCQGRDRFLGFGTALSGVFVTTGGGADFGELTTVVPTTKLCVEFLLSLDAANVGNGIYLVTSGDAKTTNNWSVRVTPGGDATITFEIRDSGGTLRSVTSDAVIPSGALLDSNPMTRVSCRWDGALMKIFINGAEDLNSTAWAGTPQNVASNLYVGYCPSDETLINSWITDVRIWKDVDRTDAQISDNALRLLAVNDSAGLVFHAKFSEGAGTITAESIDLVAATLLADSTWAYTGTGSAALAGKPMPTSFGHVWHREAILGDSASQTYHVHSGKRQVRFIASVYEGGNKLGGEWSFQTDDGVVWDSVKKRATVSSPSPGSVDFRPFAPGQQITVAHPGPGGSGNTGTKTVTGVDEEHGAWIEIAETVTDGIDIPSPGVNTTFTSSGTPDWTPLGNNGAASYFGMFTLTDVPTFTITARVLGDAGEDGASYVDTTGAIMERIWDEFLGRDVSAISASLASVDADFPYEVGYATALEDETAEGVFDRLATGIGAIWGFDVDTDFLDLFVFTEPDPVATEDVLLELTRAEIMAIERVASVPAVKKAVVTYRPNFRVMTVDELAGEVREDQTGRGIEWLNYLTGTALFAEHVPPVFGVIADGTEPVKLDKDELYSYVVRSAAAGAIAIDQYDLYGDEREIFRVGLKLQPYLVDFRRATLLVTHERWSTLAAGKRFRMVTMGGGRTNTTIEVWG